MGLKVKRFKLKEGRPNQEDLERYGFREGGSWIIKDAKWFVSKIIRKEDERYRDYEDSFNLAFKEDLNDFNDFGNVLVLDEEFGQPYTPFYGYLDGKAEGFPYLNWVISEYNEWMSSFDFLEEVKENEV